MIASEAIVPATEKSSGRKRLYITAGTVLAGAALLTAAALTDVANINLGTGSGIGVDQFRLMVAAADANGDVIAPEDEDDWVSAAGDEGVSYNLPGADLLQPDGTASVTFPILNDSESHGAQISVGIKKLSGSDDLANALLFSASFTDDNGKSQELFERVTLQDAKAGLEGVIAAGEQGSFTVTVGLSSTISKELQGETAKLRFVIDAQSV